MAYVAPAGNEAHLVFLGAYSPPAGASADFSWEFSGTPRAEGFRVTAFGTATAPSTPLGWKATSFGTPRVLTTVIGFQTVAFGSPSLVQVGSATGIFATSLGSPTVIHNTLGSNGTVFGLPNSPYLQTGVPDGFSATAFGSARLVAQCRAFGAAPSTRVSTAYYATSQTAGATGATATEFGTPVGTRRTSSGGVLCRAEGATSTSFGTHAAAWRQDAAATGSATTEFGTPTGVRARTYLVSGSSRTRFGKPRGLSRLNLRHATGATSTQFGDPASAIRARVTPMDIVSRFGTPLLTRSTTC